MSVRDLGEFQLIERITKHLKSSKSVLQGVGDDAALVATPALKGLLLTCDAMVENVHFLKVADPKDIGYKLMASNISDIAAMGGIPGYALVTVVLPPSTELNWVDSLYHGLSECADEYGVSIVGGDTSSGAEIVLTVALVGMVEPERALLRSGARVGDIIMLTGPLGASQVGLCIHTGRLSLTGELADQALQQHFRPKPRVAEGRLIAALGGHAANDISDGLASELWEIAESSGVSMCIERHLLPIHPAAQTVAIDSDDAVRYALTSGEEYELVFTLAKEVAQANKAALESFHVIGEVLEGRGAYICEGEEKIALGRGHVHFAAAAAVHQAEARRTR